MEDKVKQVIVMRQKFPDTEGKLQGVRKGKQIAQGSHASCACLADIIRTGRKATAVEKEWITNGRFTKVVLQVDTLEDILEVEKKAKAAGLKTWLIMDAGLTEFNGVPTVTALAIGPDYSKKIDPITGDLKLL